MFINSLLEQDRPMFAKQKIAFTPQVFKFSYMYLTSHYFYYLNVLVSSPSHVGPVRTDNLGSNKQHSPPTRHTNT